jgi:hypothetical protein
VTEIAALHCGMPDHAGLLRLISFTRDPTISQCMNRPSNNLVALHHAVGGTHVLEIENDSPMHEQLNQELPLGLLGRSASRKLCRLQCFPQRAAERRTPWT